MADVTHKRILFLILMAVILSGTIPAAAHQSSDLHPSEIAHTLDQAHTCIRLDGAGHEACVLCVLGGHNAVGRLTLSPYKDHPSSIRVKIADVRASMTSPLFGPSRRGPPLDRR